MNACTWCRCELRADLEQVDEAADDDGYVMTSDEVAAALEEALPAT